MPPTDGAGSADLVCWARLVDGSSDSIALLDAVAACDVTEAAAMKRLRDRWDAALVSTAIELVRARTKAARKFTNAARIVGDVSGVEQATGSTVADHKARRFAECLPPATPVLDLCCGIGGDAMALVTVADVTAIDVNPLRAWMAERNAGCQTRAADVETLDVAGAVFHLDPARRREEDARRVMRYADYVPGPAYIERLLATCPDGAIKLGPGVDLDALPVGPDREVEIIAERGSLVQTVLWCGRLARNAGRRTATRIPGPAGFSATPEPMTPGNESGFERYLLMVDPAVERAGLTGALCRDLPVREAHPGLGILTADARIESPWMNAHEVLAQFPWRPRRVAQWLAEHDGGEVTVRTRDKAIDCDRLHRALRGSGGIAYTVFGLRLGVRVVAVITRTS